MRAENERKYEFLIVFFNFVVECHKDEDCHEGYCQSGTCIGKFNLDKQLQTEFTLTFRYISTN